MRRPAQTIAFACTLALLSTGSAAAASGGYAAAVARTFRIAPQKMLSTVPPTVTIRVNQREAVAVSAKLVFTPVKGRGTRAVVNLGQVAANRTVKPAWPIPRKLEPGRYRVRLAVTGAHGAKLARSSRAPGRATVVVKRGPVIDGPITPGVFPVAARHAYGGEDSVFGAKRQSHSHEGQDIGAASGVPVVAPTPGRINATGYQASGAGHYIVMDSSDGRSFMFAHLLALSIAVLPGQQVLPGQGLGQVGSSGGTSGPHLHFEIWMGSWRLNALSRPVNPLPQLLAWDPDY